MHDGEVDRRSSNGDISVVKFVSYAFDLSQLTKSRGGMTLRAIDRDLPFLFHPDEKDHDYEANKGEYKAELHRRLTEWTFPLVYGLIAFLIAGRARTQREIRLHPVISALAIAFVLRWLSYYMSKPDRRVAILHRAALCGTHCNCRDIDPPHPERENPSDTALDEKRRGPDAIWRLQSWWGPLMISVPWTLGRYFFARYMKTLAWFFLGVAAIIFLVDFSENSGKIPIRRNRIWRTPSSSRRSGCRSSCSRQRRSWCCSHRSSRSWR